MARGFVYLAAVMDWFSRRVLSRRLLITSNSHFGFCGLAVGVIERRVSGEAGITAGLVAAWQTRG